MSELNFGVILCIVISVVTLEFIIRKAITMWLYKHKDLIKEELGTHKYEDIDKAIAWMAKDATERCLLIISGVILLVTFFLWL